MLRARRLWSPNSSPARVVGLRALNTVTPPAYRHHGGKPIDLRSDTVTLPSFGMREAMKRAQVGDDVKSEDPTINALEQEASTLLGKERALFVASGTMGNFLAIAAHCGRGDEAVVGNLSHIYNWEAGNTSALLGVIQRVVDTKDDGTFDLDTIASIARPVDDHCATTSLVCVENTHNMVGGRVLSLAYLAQLQKLAQKQSMRVHMDGARLFNASVKLGCAASTITSHVDSVSVCLSKGLGCPAGGILAGSHDFIARARRVRKMIGGGMRQAGVLAATGRFALQHNIERLAADHKNAARLAHGMAQIPYLVVTPASVETNIVNFELRPNSGVTEDVFVRELEGMGVFIDGRGYGRFRAVTNLNVSRHDVDEVLQKMARVGKEQTFMAGAAAGVCCDGQAAPDTAADTTAANAKDSTPTATRVRWDHQRLYVDWSDNTHSSFLHMWLRDHCPQSINPASLQREVNTLQIPTNTHPLGVSTGNTAEGCQQAITIKWESAILTHHGLSVDTSVFPSQWLHKHSYNRTDKETHTTYQGGETAPAPVLWTTTSQATNGGVFAPPEADANAVLSSEEGLRAMMLALRDHGIVLVRNMPLSLEGTLELARRIGYVQRTIWGDGWDTKPKDDGGMPDTAYSNIELPPHTDCCYLSSPCELQLFNCISPSDDPTGGQTWCVDSFSVAEHLRATNREAFDFFASVPLRFHCTFADTSVLNTSPVFVTDDNGRLTRFVYNNDDRAVLDHLDERTIKQFYTHLPALLEPLRSGDKRFSFEHRLAKGEMIIVRNTRVLHARRAFKGRGRTMVGCYIDTDAFESRLRVMGLLPPVGLPL